MSWKFRNIIEIYVYFCKNRMDCHGDIKVVKKKKNARVFLCLGDL